MSEERKHVSLVEALSHAAALTFHLAESEPSAERAQILRDAYGMYQAALAAAPQTHTQLLHALEDDLRKEVAERYHPGEAPPEIRKKLGFVVHNLGRADAAITSLALIVGRKGGRRG
jgi:hypothetical protein